ncbi:hypothetical protein pb186bvf_002483 [Paramecium bursaria]
MKSQQDVEKFILKLQEDVSFDISLSNSIILYQKAQNSRSTQEAADCYSKAIILLQDALIRKKCISSVQQLLDICIENIDCLQLNPIMPENQQANNQSVETLEQINHIDQLEDKIVFIIKRMNNILQKGGMLTQHVYFHPRFWDQQAADSRPRIIIYKFCSQSIDKLIVLYKYTPEAEIKNLSCELLDTLQNLQLLVKNKQVKEQEDLLYWLQQFFKSSTQLVDLFHEKYGRVPSNLKDQIYQEIYKVAQSGILEIVNQLRNHLKQSY